MAWSQIDLAPVKKNQKVLIVESWVHQSRSLEFAASGDSEQQVEKSCPLPLGEPGERGRKDIPSDRMACLENLPAGRRQMVLDPPATAGPAPDQTLAGEPVGEGSKRLVALKRLDRQRVGGGTRGPSDRSKRVPLGKGRPNCAQPGVERAMVPVLNLLDRSSQGFQIGGHVRSIPLSKLAYINMLI